MSRLSVTLSLVSAATLAVAAFSGPDTEPFGPAQSAADVLRTATKADIAFIPAGVIKANARPGDLSNYLLFPTDEVSVVSLTGSQIRHALELSISLYPSPNPGFLQVSGILVTYSKSAAADKRITGVTLAGANIEADKKYRVAMPGSLARGGLGYFTIWDKKQIVETLQDRNIEAVLKGKSGSDNAPRWKSGE